jgi:hypothetical protein
MKQCLRALLCLCFIFSATRSFSQSTGYISCPDVPANQGAFYKAKKTTNGYITLGQSGSGFSNHEVIYWDANFHTQWNLNFAGAVVLYWIDVIELNDGNFLAFGANQNHTGCNIAVKISPAGAIVWQREYYLSGTFLTSFAVSKAAGNDPGFVFGGGACAASAFLIRCDADGNIVWQHEYFITGSSGVETTQTIIAENNAYILGGNLGFGAQNDVFITKVDSTGTCLWSNYVSEPTYNQIPAKMIKLSTGNYAMLCQYNSNPNYAQLIYYFNSTGAVTGGTKFLGPAQEQIDLVDLAEISGGRTILVGDINDSPMKFLYMELSATGAIIWQKKSVGVTGNYLNGFNSAIAKTPGGKFACFGGSYQDGRTIAVIDSLGAGYCNGVAATVSAVTPETYTSTATTPIIIAPNVLTAVVTNTSNTLTLTSSTLCGTVGMDESARTDELLSVYPNPAHDVITLWAGEKELVNAEVVFWNVLGEKVYAVSGSSSTIDISGLTAGVYLMEVVVDGERVVKRVVKE